MYIYISFVLFLLLTLIIVLKFSFVLFDEVKTLKMNIENLNKDIKEKENLIQKLKV